MQTKRALLTSLCIAFMLPFTMAWAEPQSPVGTPVSRVLATDIVALVNGKPVPSMNINGFTAVAAEDLRAYGFDVAWIPQEKKVTIRPNPDKPVQPLLAEASSDLPVGTKLGDVLSTDILAYYGDRQIPSYNIDGRTAIVLNDLAPFGNVQWQEKERKLTYSPSISQSDITEGAPEGAGTDNPAEAPLMIRQTGTKQITALHIGDRSITYGPEKVGFIRNERSLFSLSWMASAFGYGLHAGSDESYTVKSSTYSFRFYPGEKSAELYWFGSPVQTYDWLTVPVQEDGEWFIAEADLKNLLGLSSEYNPETRMLNLEYKEYRVEDYGLPAGTDTYFYKTGAIGYVSGKGIVPSLWTSNRISGKESLHGGGSSWMTDEQGDGTYPRYSFGSMVDAGFGQNSVEVSLSVNQRLLFHQSVDFTLGMKDVKPVIDYSGPYSRGDFTVIKSVYPEQAYQTTDQSSITLSGTVGSKVGSLLTYVVEKQDRNKSGEYLPVTILDVPMEAEAFKGTVPLDQGEGLYRVTVKSGLSTPNFASSIDVARWYIQKK